MTKDVIFARSKTKKLVLDVYGGHSALVGKHIAQVTHVAHRIKGRAVFCIVRIEVITWALAWPSQITVVVHMESMQTIA